jgi:DNA polymerase III delta subunit
LTQSFQGDSFALDNELSMLSLVFMGNPITLENVKAYVQVSAREGAFQLVDKILASKIPAAINQLQALLSRGENAIGILAVLAHFFRQAIKIKGALLAGIPTSAVAKEVSCQAWIVNKYHPWVQRRSWDHLAMLQLRAQEGDQSLKGHGKKGKAVDVLVALLLDC